MVWMLACCVTFLFTSSMWPRLRVGVGGARQGGGLLVMVGRGGMEGMEANAPMLVRAAVIVAAIMLAMAALMDMLDMLGMLGMPGIPMDMLGMLGMPMVKFRGKGRGGV